MTQIGRGVTNDVGHITSARATDFSIAGPPSETRNMIRPISRTRTAFTLVELLVVIAIIGTLVALLIPAVQMARESGRRALCNSNLHQIALAIAQHEEAFGTMPPGLPNCVDRSKFGIAGGVEAGAWCQGPNWAIAEISSNCAAR